MRDKLGGQEALIRFRETYHNIKLEEILLNAHETDKIITYKNSLIRKDEPVYKSPEMNFGRAHFFAPEKRFMNLLIDTYWFNLLIIILMALFFYVLLLYEVLKKFIDAFSQFHFYSAIGEWRKHIVNAIRPVIKNK